MKISRGAVLAVVILAAAAGFFGLYRMFQPEVHILRDVLRSDARYPGEEYYRERIRAAVSIRENAVMPDALSKALRELSDWNNEIDTDLSEHYAAPLHIEAGGKVEGGTTTFWYSGFAATEDGGRADYYKEASFHYVFAPGEELFQS